MKEISLAKVQEFTLEISNLEKLKEFLKELGDIEREYSRKLNNLRRYNSNFPDLLEFTLEKSSHSSDFCLEIQDILKNLTSTLERKESTRKNLNSWITKLNSEKEKINAKVVKGKDTFDKSCDQVQVLQLKLGKVAIQKIQKVKKELNSKIIDMNNDKNDYIATIRGVNSVNKEFGQKILPQVVQNIHDSTKTVVNSVLDSCKSFQESQERNYTRNMSSLDKFKRNLEKFDFKDYFQEQEPKIEEVKDYEFISSGLWKDKDEYLLDENSKVYIWNTKEKLEKRIQKMNEELEVLENGIQGLEALKKAYTSDDKNKDDVDVVEENILESKRSRLLLMLNLSFYTKQLNEISPHVQDMETITPHQFKSSMFTIPTTCELCSQYIWGISKPGMTCTVCGMNAHLKCEMKVAPECSAVKEKRLRNKTSSMISFSNSRLSVLSNSTEISLSNIISIPNGAKAVALYDYIPNSSANDELDMAAGDELVVVTEDDGSGWTKVSRSGSEGLVPTSYIQTKKDIEPAPSPLASTAEKTKFSGSLAKVLFDYQRKEDDELTVYAGQSVWIVIEDDGSGWTQVTNGTESGHVPSSYLSMADY